MNKKIIETITIAIVTITMLAIVILGFDKALDNYEIVECYKLQSYAEEYKNFLYSLENSGGFYLTAIEKEMCDYHNIIVDAPVR
jgi:hypothetical protein